MTLYANLCANARFAVPGGMPALLSSAGGSVLEGILPKRTGGISATVKSVLGVTAAGDGSDPTDNAPTTANVYLALYATPSTVGGSDGLQVGSTSSIAGLGAMEQAITVSVPDSATTTPAVYIWRLWVETSGTNGVEVSTLEAT